MQIDTSKYYVGSYQMEDQVTDYYKAGVKVEKKDLNGSSVISSHDTVVKYDFEGNEDVGNLSLQEKAELYRSITSQYDSGVLLEISGLGKLYEVNANGKLKLDDFWEKMDKEVQLRNEGFVTEIHPLTKEEHYMLTLENLKYECYYGEDKKNILNHSFLNCGYQFEQEFHKAAIGYAKYLNNEIESNYNDVIFCGFGSEESYRIQVRDIMQKYSENILSYFMMGKAGEKEKEKLTNQLVDTLIEYSKQAAAGNQNINDLKTKLTINGVDMTYGELTGVQNALQKVNEAGVSSKEEMEKDNMKYFNILYVGLSCGIDPGAFSQLGLRTSQMKFYCDNNLSADVGKMVMDVYEKRVNETVKVKYIEVERQNAKDRAQLVQWGIAQIGNYNSVMSDDWKGYAGQNWETYYNFFAHLDTGSKEDFQVSFQQAIKNYDEYMYNKPLPGYYGSEQEKERFDYLLSTLHINGI